MEITSIINRIQESFLENFNAFLEQVPNIIGAIVIIVIGFLIAHFLTNVFRKTVSSKVADPLMTNFLTRTVKLSIGALEVRWKNAFSYQQSAVSNSSCYYKGKE